MANFGIDVINQIKLENPHLWTPAFRDEVGVLTAQKGVELEYRYAEDTMPRGGTGFERTDLQGNTFVFKLQSALPTDWPGHPLPGRDQPVSVDVGNDRSKERKELLQNPLRCRVPDRRRAELGSMTLAGIMIFAFSIRERAFNTWGRLARQSLE